jgi:phosphopantetheinyl transferase
MDPEAEQFRRLGADLRRRLAELVGFAGAVAVEPDGDPARRRQNTALALSRVFGRPVPVRYRPDGRPEVGGGWYVSASHGAGVTLAAAAREAIGCDIEPVVERDRAEWASLLGGHVAVADRVAADAGEPLSAAATRVWVALEAVQKVGERAATPLTSRVPGPARWVTMTAGLWRVATVVTTLRDRAPAAAVAVAVAAKAR